MLIVYSARELSCGILVEPSPWRAGRW